MHSQRSIRVLPVANEIMIRMMVADMVEELAMRRLPKLATSLVLPSLLYQGYLI
jgi:hypothetical protein